MWTGNVDRLLNKSLTNICQLGGWGGPVGHYEKVLTLTQNIEKCY